MKVKEFMDSMKAMDERLKGTRPYSETMAEATDIWSNNAALGYLIEAAKRAGVNEETTRAIVSEMRGLFENMSINEAEQRYINY